MTKTLKAFFNKYEWTHVLRQLGAEFSIPLLISVAWTMLDTKGRSTADLLQIGIVHFFAVGWAFSQWNRVKKQIKTERNLSGVGDDVKSLIRKLEQQTDDLIGYSTGKDSFCLAEFVPSAERAPFVIMLRHHGKYPVFDLSVEIFDHNVIEDLYTKGVTHITDRIKFHFPSVHPLDYKTLNFSPGPKVNNSGQVKISFLCASRSGEYRQDLMAELVKEQWIYATRVVEEGVVTSEFTPPDFPRNKDGYIDWYAPFCRP
jgi:hypothetical protein